MIEKMDECKLTESDLETFVKELGQALSDGGEDTIHLLMILLGMCNVDIKYLSSCFAKAKKIPKEYQPGTDNFEILVKARFDQNAELKWLYCHALFLYCMNEIRTGASFMSIIRIITMFSGEEMEDIERYYHYTEEAKDDYPIEEIISDIEYILNESSHDQNNDLKGG